MFLRGTTPSETCAIAVMAKAPIPGRAKTRLTPWLSPDQAAGLGAAFLRDTTENIAAAAALAPIEGFVAFAPAGSEDLFAGLLAAGTALVLADGSRPAPPGVSGFGACLLHAIAALLERGYGAACVLNADGPTLPTAELARAATMLLAGPDRAVIGAAEDGGYYLLGMRRAHACLFTDIAWSTGAVAAQTRARADAAGLPLDELTPWYDVDEPEDLRRLIGDLDRTVAPGAAIPFPAPATASRLAALGLRQHSAAAD